MRKASILAIFVVAGLAYGASETWKTKPYQQWDQNDVKEILTASPWVKHTMVTATWKNGSLTTQTTTQTTAPNQPGQGSPTAQQRPGMGGPPGAGGTQPGSQDQPSPIPMGSETSFSARWSSAQTVREAVARDAVLNGRFSEAQAEQYVDQEPPVYQILLYGPDMTPFANETNDTLKSKAYIEVKPSKEKVSPSSVEIVKGTDGKTIQSVVFSFPKQGANAQSLFSADDKQAQFDCKLKGVHLNMAFDLRKMMGKNGPDL
ncbi:MAG: hypothetical protein WA876_01910 [Candidatus Acidiferrales bacterium]